MTSKKQMKKVPVHRVKKVQNEVSGFDLVKRRIIFSIVLLGIFSILAGIGLIVAANWASIPPIIKVSVGLAVLAASLVTTAHFQKNEKPLWMEAFLFVSFLLVGGNIALIQQSYGLSLSWQAGSLAWWGLSLPLVFFTKYKLIPYVLWAYWVSPFGILFGV